MNISTFKDTKLPGLFVNVHTNSSNAKSSLKNGVVLLPLQLNFGPEKKFVEIFSVDDIITNFGKLDEHTLPIVECLKKAYKVIVYRLNSGNPASFSINDNSNIISTFSGKHSNLLSLSIKRDINSDDFIFYTYLDGKKYFQDIVSSSSKSYSNKFISYNGEINSTSGVFLTGGSTVNATNNDFLDFLNAAQSIDFNTLCLIYDNVEIKNTVISFIKKLRDEENKAVNAVIPETENVDYEGIISVKNGVVLNDSTILPKSLATAFVAAASASSSLINSNTYLEYPEALDVDTYFSNSQLEEILNKGHIVFSKVNGKVVIIKDINTFISFTPLKNSSFSKNRFIRTIDTIIYDIRNIFFKGYVGKISNNEHGRELFKGDVISYLQSCQDIGAISEFDSNSDVEVSIGSDIDSVYLQIYIKPVDSFEKVYLNISVN